jgi:arylsulfatase
MVGKWHLTPAHEVTPAGPYRNWPASRGFDRYYGFLGGCTDHYAPELIQDNHTVDPVQTEGYHLSEDLCERAVTYLRDHAAFRRTSPFFLNFCFGATHAPIQVPREYIDPYVPSFEKGWDKTRQDRLARQKALGLLPQDTDLVPRNPEVPAWDGLGNDEKRLYTRLQAAYAGFLEHSDAQIGRLVAELKRLNLFDNTIIVILSDNGASREGGQHGAVDVNAPYSGAPETVAEMLARIDDIGGPAGPPTIRKAGRWRAGSKTGAASAISFSMSSISHRRSWISPGIVVRAALTERAFA